MPCQNSIPARQDRFFLWRSQLEARIEREVWRRRTRVIPASFEAVRHNILRSGARVPSRRQEHQLRQPPQPTDGNPEELVEQIESRPRTTPSQVNCGRSTKFSKMRSRRLRNIRRSAPNASQSRPSIIRFITRVMASGRCYVIDFSAGQSFGEAQV